MAKNSKIAWTDHTWNPWQGCHKVSPGCLNCYMYSAKRRFAQDPAKIVRSKPATFNSPESWTGPAKVFVCSWSDFFIIQADPWRDEAWEIMRRADHLTFLILTKRPENIEPRLPEDWPLPNVWLGVTAENQKMAEERIPILLRTPAVIRFVSVEPMIGPIELLERWTAKGWCGCGGCWQKESGFPCSTPLRGLDWVICGGESGPGARPLRPDWVRSLRDQCAAAGVAFMFKQWGEYTPGSDFVKMDKSVFVDIDGNIFPGDKPPLEHAGQLVVMRKVGKKAAGRLLDGKEYMEVPA